MKNAGIIGLVTLGMVMWMPYGCQQSTQHTPDGEMNTLLDSASYAIGMDIARFYAKQQVTLNPELLYRGVRETLDSQQVLTDSQAIQVITVFGRDLQGKMQQTFQLKMVENEIREREFLEQNRKNAGMLELPSGIQYTVLSAGDPNGASPRMEDSVQLSYVATFLDGTVMDRSDRYPQPLVIDVAGIEIRGLVSTLTMMRPGDHWKIFIPSSMAYGKAGKPNVAPPNAMLIFDLTLEKVTKPRP